MREILVMRKTLRGIIRDFMRDVMFHIGSHLLPRTNAPLRQLETFGTLQVHVLLRAHIALVKGVAHPQDETHPHLDVQRALAKDAGDCSHLVAVMVPVVYLEYKTMIVHRKCTCTTVLLFPLAHQHRQGLVGPVAGPCEEPWHSARHY